MALTRIGIINLALDQAGLDSSFQTKARNWMNVITTQLSFETRYKFYNKYMTPDTPFVPGQSKYTLPTDYQRSDTIYLINSDGSRGNEIFLVEPYRFDATTYYLNGLPNTAMIDLEGGKIVFNNTPTSTNNSLFRFRYFRKPAVLSTDNTDDAVIPDFESQDVLIQELIKMAFFHQDDDRYQAQKAQVTQSKQEHQRNMYEAESMGQVDLAHAQFRQRWRR